ncbi:MAG: bifunctional phosphoribosyl-AMP cyclohydrolase/phosphoribosyl-ATP diphosphatase HisIE [Thermoanaerobaculia bacterium]|nr:bifunctional phosphoribosyl-AMP cyclohydrolase/phosphoribosyl-ATP diphosphatase HisIE [Thermoanaerobaculia bacterium]
MLDPANITFDSSGLVPAIIRDSRSGEVLTLAYMNRESLRLTIESGETWLWSRSRQELWHKGATSGNTQRVVAMAPDCDGDAILVDVEPRGPACHTGARSCFGDARFSLSNLEDVLRQRKSELPEGSYSAKLFRGGRTKILKKIGEESAEVIIAATSEGRERVVSESADLVFHLLALLVHEGIALDEVVAALGSRAR